MIISSSAPKGIVRCGRWGCCSAEYGKSGGMVRTAPPPDLSVGTRACSVPFHSVSAYFALISSDGSTIALPTTVFVVAAPEAGAGV